MRVALLCTVLQMSAAAVAAPPQGLTEAVAAAKATLRQKHPAETARIERGVDQVARQWRASDGDAAAFRAFALPEFLPAGEPLDAAFARLEHAFERAGGYFTSLGRDLRRGLDVDTGPLQPIDHRLGA